MNSRIDAIYKRGIEKLDAFYKRDSVIEDSVVTIKGFVRKKPQFKREKKCAYPGCDKYYIARGLTKMCPEHRTLQTKETRRSGWITQNENRKALRRKRGEIS